VDGAELRHTCVVKTQESSTRERVARSVLENGPSSAHTLGQRLGLTPAGIRRHLEALQVDGLLSAHEPRVSASSRSRGRPAKVFIITDRGREKFEHSYDDLAVSALRYLVAAGGSDALMGFAQSRAIEIERRHAPALAKVRASQRLSALASGLSDDGFVASIQTTPVALGHELCQHHCPIAHVAVEFPELCEAETEAFGRLLGTHVQRLATIAHGDGVCTTFVPAIRTETVNRKTSDDRRVIV
jgi:predicted ArsR family transcriptional regulator